jgi:hypothetical protein
MSEFFSDVANEARAAAAERVMRELRSAEASQ